MSRRLRHSQSQQNMQNINEPAIETLTRIRNELNDLLQATAGEQSLHSAVGRWQLQVAEAIFEAGEASISNQAIIGQKSIDFVERIYRQNGNLVVVAGGVTGVFGGSPLIVTTSQANEKVAVTFTAQRTNSSAGGSGRYQFNIDLTEVGFLKEIVGNVANIISMTDVFTIPNPGTHIIGVDVTAVNGSETVFEFATLVATGYLI